MKTRTVVFVTMICVGSMCVLQRADANSLIANGDFANIGNVFFDNTGFGSNDLRTGGVNIPGWSNVAGFANEFWVGSPNGYGLAASPGNASAFFVDLTGQFNTQPFGGIQQTITTTIGDNYKLTFDLGASTRYNSGVSAGSALTASATGASSLASQLFSLTPTSANDWATETLSFTANSTSTVIAFLGDSANSSSAYIGLDNVALVDIGSAVPEASTWAMIILGFLGVGVMAHRKSGGLRLA